MAIARDRLRPPATYDADFYSWALEQAALLKARRFAELDLENLAEEVEDLGKAQARELESRYATLVQHLLKWQFQPEQRSFGWLGTIRRERIRIAKLLASNPGLTGKRSMLFRDAWAEAMAGAVADTGLPTPTFPSRCPFTETEACDDAFLPGAPWDRLDEDSYRGANEERYGRGRAR